MQRGYVAAALSMSMAIVIFVVLDLVHPPAVATALTFAFVEPKERTIALFLLSVGLLAVLVILQRISAWALHRLSAEKV